MSSDLELRLVRALRALPRSASDVEERARRAALAALPGSGPRRGLGWQRALVLVAAALVVLVAGAAALAEIGAIQVRLGKPTPRAHASGPAPLVPRLTLPPGAAGFTVSAGGRLWLTTRGGVRIERLPVSAATLSPRALYVAAGIGSSLVAMAPSGARAWMHPAGGRVVAAAWAPSGLQIAYVVARGATFQLRLIEGDGDHDRLVDSAVAPVAPSWRADSLALAYVGAGGRATVYDLGHRSWRVVGGGACGPGRVRAISFAPAGDALAFVTWNVVYVDGGGGRGRARAPACKPYEDVISFAGLAWAGPNDLVTTDNPAAGVVTRSHLRRYRITPDGSLRPVAAAVSRARLGAVSARYANGPLALVVRGGARSIDVVAVDPPRRAAKVLPLRPLRRLLRTRGSVGSASLAWR